MKVVRPPNEPHRRLIRRIVNLVWFGLTPRLFSHHFYIPCLLSINLSVASHPLVWGCDRRLSVFGATFVGDATNLTYLSVFNNNPYLVLAQAFNSRLI